MQARPNEAFLRELREKLDPALEMHLDEATIVTISVAT